MTDYTRHRATHPAGDGPATARAGASHRAYPRGVDVIAWLMDADPAIRWQVLRDISGADEADVTRERARVATEGWGAALLASQDPDGRWDGGTYRPGWAREDRPF